jgi:prophage maintenance system killer protein
MIEIFTEKKERIAVLEKGEILKLHKILSENYHLLPEMEPVSPPGVKNETLLDSAIHRQLTGSGDYYKYPDIYLNCSTLVFGIIKNHSFHNGNKRMGFLAMVKHLYCNGNVLRPNIGHEEIFQLLRDLAGNTMAIHAKKYNPKYFKKLGRKVEWNSDIVVDYLAYWLRHNTVSKVQKIKSKTLAINDLKSILGKKNLNVDYDGKFLKVSKEKSFFQNIFGHKSLTKSYTIKNNKEVNFGIIETIRRDFELTHIDGVDNVTFYDTENFINDEIRQYKKIIYKLAKI